MAAASTPAPVTPPASPPAATSPVQSEHAPPQPKAHWPWLKYVTPVVVVLLALAVLITLTRDWNAWEGGKIEQVTDDAFVRGDLTPLSTKVAGIVRTVKVSDYQKVHAGDLLVELQADVTRTRAERTRQEALLAAQSATQQRVEGAVADEQRFAAQAASRDADLEQAKTALRSNEIGVEAERRTKAVLESQEQQLIADLHAKEASFTVAQVNLG